MSKMDRIYFSTIKSKKGFEKCVYGAKSAVKNIKGDLENDGVVYILNNIPEECIPTIDEDVNLGFTKKTHNPEESLKYIGSFGLKGCTIPKESLKKLTIKEFYELGEKFDTNMLFSWETFKKYML